MANINSMAMSSDLVKDQRVNMQKTLFGLSTKWTYTPTGSKLKPYKFEYSPEGGKAVMQAINASDDKRADLLAQLHVDHVSMGNYMLEAVCSYDCQFVAMRLYQYQNLRFQPASPLCVLEGDDAAKLAPRF